MFGPARNTRSEQISEIGGTGVQVNVIARHGDLADGTQQKIAQKLQKLSRFNDRISAVDVTIDLADAREPTVEVIVDVEKANDFIARVKTTNGNLIGAVEAASQKLQEQLKRYKEKKIDSHRIPVPPGEEGAEGREDGSTEDGLDGSDSPEG